MRNVRYLDKLRRAAVKRLGGLMPDEAFYGGPKEEVTIRTDYPIVKARSSTVIPGYAAHVDFDAIRMQLSVLLAKFMAENGCLKTETDHDDYGNTIVTATVYVAKGGDAQCSEKVNIL